MARERAKGGRRGKRDNNEVMLQKKSRHLEGVKNIDLADHDLLGKFMTEHGKILPARMTGANAKQQRQIRHGIKRCRNIGLLP